MPNHVTNILKTSQSVLAVLKSDQQLVDFSRIIPMPESIKDTQSNGDAHLVELLNGEHDLTRKSDDILCNLILANVLRDLESGGISKWPRDRFCNFLRMLQNYRDYGATDWYRWSCKNWDTKWNAYSIESIDEGVKFETAWSAPHSIIEKLAKMFPNEKIQHEWADEDIGNNLGKRLYYLGEVADILIDDPVDFALTLNEDDRKYYRKNLITEKWEYFDESEEVGKSLKT